MKIKPCKFNSLIFLIFLFILPIGLIFHLNFYSKSTNPAENKFNINNEINNPSTSIDEEWNLTYDGPANQGSSGRGVTVDAQGNVYTTGYTNDALGYDDIILRKYNKTGGLVWENITDGPWEGTNDNDWGFDVAVDDNYNVYLTGFMCNTSDKQVCFLMKFNSDGTLNWSTTWNATNADWDKGFGVAIDKFNDIYVCGTYKDQIVDRERGFLLKYNETGDLNWSKTYSAYDPSRTYIYDIAIDSENNITLVGYNYTGSDSDIQIVKYNPLGIQLWNRTFNAVQNDKGKGISIDSNDNLCITGTLAYNTILIAKYDKYGQHIKNVTFKDGINQAQGIGVVKSTDDIFATFTDGLGGNTNCSLIKFNSTLDLQWRLEWDSGEAENAAHLCVDGSKYVYINGVKLAPSPFVILLIKFSLLPEHISLVGNSLGDPDPDGDFQLDWTNPSVLDTHNYTLYNHTSFITEINGSLNSMANETTQTTWNVWDLPDGMYYYIVEGHNKYGNTTSNCLTVNVIHPPDAFNLYENATDPRDTDGIFWLEWNWSNNADNYSVWYNTVPIAGNISDDNLYINGLTDNKTLIDFSGMPEDTYYFTVVANNTTPHGYVIRNSSNEVAVTIKFPPFDFSVDSDAGNPDKDGIFKLLWTVCSNADNYSIFWSKNPISKTNINASNDVFVYKSNITNSVTEWSIEIKDDGTYYFVVLAFNIVGNKTTDYIVIIVEIPDGGSTPDGIDPLLMGIIIGAIGAVAVLSVVVIRKRSRKDIREKDAELLMFKEKREQITEDDILISKEKHFCLVHKGPVEGLSYICPECNAYYCVKCYNAIKEAENECWSCRIALDASRPKPKREIKEEDSKPEMEFKKKGQGPKELKP